jgi:manganese/zinc/iron transport system substrate-binding protein
VSSAIARIFATVLLGLTACAMFGCGRADAPTAGAPREHGPSRERVVVATSTLCADLARTVCEGVPGVRVEGLMPAGVDPHLWRPTAGGARTLARAEVVVANGLRLEGRMADVLPKLARSGCTVFEASSAIPMDRWRTSEDAHGQPDPHVCMDPALWAQAAEGLASFAEKRAGRWSGAA